MKHIAKRLLLAVLLSATALTTVSVAHAGYVTNVSYQAAEELYNELELAGKLDYDVFEEAVNAFVSLDGKNKPYLTIIDYSKPSSDKRFFVIDMENREVLFNTYVAHGKNSGAAYSTEFSNIQDSKQTSLGVFITSTTYDGSNGYSLRLDGLSPGINDNARNRYIVVHGADYAEESFLKSNGQLGRSWGCPAVPNSIARSVIDTIKDGSVIYAHG
uniref:murein L,D-transpeptidase catalytic domain family protein n=1 Tax=Thaumasiovibrio occultus TaxID=1891184 RepID=UPI000B34D199|nr:murein L,D-transpeptidase catalytic domain family protein [Thaumasiovibrio occultus]